jgi:hypothetical protein
LDFNWGGKINYSGYQADQNHSIQEEKIQFLDRQYHYWLFITAKQSKFPLILEYFSALPVFILVGLIFFAFKTTFKTFKPKISLWKIFKGNNNLGFKFCYSNCWCGVVFDRCFIITRLWAWRGLPCSTFKYFSIVTMAYTIIITPIGHLFYWSYAKRFWMDKKIRVQYSKNYGCLFRSDLSGMFFLADWFYKLWVGNKVIVPIRFVNVNGIICCLTKL